ncbi:hypothetical protein EOW65_05560 [Sinirhodobacter ferrireducens]|uniref:Uncharacterized protein n=1 Tax=Paenirhodobacter ferrireducens TaxID=1215032 RepID=A0A443LPB9_9RHOB|nr:hypothetical protein [Sinirhodobacter ferrireducens]RWR51022.1 hypothetical protein EOW65_05560 [Sinirhodobacter ferrireducens]
MDWFAICFITGVWTLEGIVKWLCIDRLVGLPHFAMAPDFGPLKRRLHAYDQMKRHPKKFCEFVPAEGDDGLLSGGQHEILLGVLKKVEAKNAVLATFWSIVMAALVAFAFSSSCERLGVFPISLVAVCAPFLTAILLCAVQLDQIDANRTLASSCEDMVVAQKMQEALMLDLLKKEAAFRFSWLGAMFSVLAALVLSGLFAARAFPDIWP